MINFVGAGPGDVELISVKGARLLGEADIVIYAGSLVNKALLAYTREGTEIYDSAGMTLPEVLEVMKRGTKEGKNIVRLHTGDPAIYGAIKEQMDALEEENIPYGNVPGISSFLAAAAALKAEYTLPDVSQTVIITRLEGRTPVPKAEKLSSLAAHGSTMCIFLSIHMIEDVVKELKQGGYTGETPIAIVEKASWPEEKKIIATLDTIAEIVKAEGINKTALVIVGDFLKAEYSKSKLYDPSFTHGYRIGKS